MTTDEGDPERLPANAYAQVALAALLMTPLRSAGFHLYGPLPIRLAPDRLPVPDLVVLRAPTSEVAPDLVVMPIGLVSPSSVRKDRVHKPAWCAVAGIPYYLLVDVRKGTVHIELLRLADTTYVRHATADLGEQFRTDLPAPFAFDTGQLLDG